MNFTTQLITIIGIILTLLITLLINWKTIKKSIKHDDFSSLRNIATSIKRRKFLYGSVIVVGFGTWTLLSTFVPERVKRIISSLLPDNDMIVVNKKTGVMHHKVYCKNHLPDKKNINYHVKYNTQLKFHETKKVEILSNLSQGRTAEDAIEVLLLATENNLTSVHLYDALIKLLGKLKRYESMPLLLTNAENKLINMMKLQSKGTKEYKKHVKALSHIQLQKNKILERARYRTLKI